MSITTAEILNKPVTISYDYVITGTTGIWSGTIRPTYGLGGNNKTVSNEKLSGSVVETVTLTTVSTTKYSILTVGLPEGAKVVITNLKVEYGTVKSHYMPSSSEVQASDYPSYIGTYTDSKEESSDNYLDYKWEKV